MTEEPLIFGNHQPFTLIHADDLPVVLHFLARRHIPFDQTPSGPALFKLTFRSLDGAQARHLMRELTRSDNAEPRQSTRAGS